MSNGTAPGPLGYIVPSQRNPTQQAAHAKVMAAMPRFAMPAAPAGPLKFALTEFFRKPEVIADMGMEFEGFRQLTGSCVGVSLGNDIALISAIQRMLTEGATHALIPFWPFAYGRTRYNEGDRGQGEGAVDSVAGATAHTEGTFAWTESGLPTYSTNDGIAISTGQEYQWSDGGSIAQKWKDLAKPNTIGTVTPVNDVQSLRGALANGYPILDGCDNYCGHGSIKGTGDDALCVGKYDGRGGHSTAFVGVWDHPSFGPHYLYWNQWNRSTYPTDPVAKLRCSVWLPESEVEKLFRTGGDRGETMALSHLNYKEVVDPFPPQPKTLDWFIAP